MPNASSVSLPKWYIPRICAVSPTGPEVALAVGEAVDLGVELEPWQTVPAEQQWQRRAEPVLSTTNTTQDWSRVMLYMPGVIRADGMYKMWYVGTSGPPRPANCHLGYATSQDGIHWEEYPDNPIVTDEAPARCRRAGGGAFKARSCSTTWKSDAIGCGSPPSPTMRRPPTASSSR